MLLKLILLFTLVPIVELVILITIGTYIGALKTILIVILTGVLGAALAKIQGLKTLYHIRDKLAMGILPTGDILNGFLILAAGLLLLTPGLITDAVGFLVLIPFTRRLFKNWCRKQFQKMINGGRVTIVRPGDV
jgi:UPF0716 protein FxsA